MNVLEPPCTRPVRTVGFGLTASWAIPCRRSLYRSSARRICTSELHNSYHACNQFMIAGYSVQDEISGSFDKFGVILNEVDEKRTVNKSLHSRLVGVQKCTGSFKTYHRL